MQAVVADGKQAQTLVTGMNGVRPALKSIKEGNLAMTVELSPVQWGRLGVDTIKAFLDGSPPKGPTYVGCTIIDKTNVDTVLKPAAGH